MLIEFLKTGQRNAFLNMAIDEILMQRVEKTRVPILRFYYWKPRAVSIGYFQNLQQEVDVKHCNELGIDIVRRQTGGGAVLHDQEVTYSFITHQYESDILDSYKSICGAIINGLKSLGINGEFSPLNDLTVNGKKFSGNAQTRKNGKLLQHGTILLDVDVDLMFSVLKVPNEKLKDKIIASVKDRVCGIKKEPDEVENAILKGFESDFHAEFINSKLTKGEENAAETLANKKYNSKSWTGGR